MAKSLEPFRRHNIQMGMRFEPELVARIDAWRNRSAILPERAAAVRALLKQALDAEGIPPGAELIAQKQGDHPSTE